MNKALPLVVVVAFATLASLAIAADPLISLAQCARINPNPVFLSCSQYTEPYTDILTGLPYNTVPEYTQCVRQRCVCTGEKTDIDDLSWQTSGLFCSTSGWQESGGITCNVMVQCFKLFWQCTLDALMERSNSGATLDAAETTAVNAIISHGRTPGQPFDETDMFRSCRMIMCNAAASRVNCGLRTCLPNNTQCYEYIKPPPLPDVHQLCTQGCRAVLVLMALTLATFVSALLCCACCPAPVVEKEPLLLKADEDSDDKKHRSNSDAQDSGFDVASNRENGKDGDATRNN